MGRLSISSADGPVIEVDGRRLVSFGGCNYLGLSWHPSVKGAMRRGLEEFGVSTSASRETTGNTTAHDRLEQRLVKFLGAESVVVVPDGYTANLAAAQALSATHRAAAVDSKCHRSIREALMCAGMKVAEFDHLDADDAGRKVRGLGNAGTVWTDGVFASDGSAAPLDRLSRVCADAKAVLVVDDCHGLCTMGPRGRGTPSHFGVRTGPGLVITSTLAKGLGCHGGFVAGTAELGQRVRTASMAYVCTTPVSPAIAAAAVEALGVLDREDRLRRLRVNATELAAGLRSAGIDVGDHGTPIFAFTLGSEAEMRGLHEHLLTRGMLAPVISYPDGPAPVYFRLSVTSEHTFEQIEGLCRAVGEWMARGVQTAREPAR